MLHCAGSNLFLIYACLCYTICHRPALSMHVHCISCVRAVMIYACVASMICNEHLLLLLFTQFHAIATTPDIEPSYMFMPYFVSQSVNITALSRCSQLILIISCVFMSHSLTWTSINDLSICMSCSLPWTFIVLIVMPSPVMHLHDLCMFMPCPGPWAICTFSSSTCFISWASMIFACACNFL